MDICGVAGVGLFGGFYGLQAVDIIHGIESLAPSELRRVVLLCFGSPPSFLRNLVGLCCCMVVFI